MMTDDDRTAAWRARDRGADGAFVVAVRTTRIYCKPSCAARQPLRTNVTFLPDGATARAAGYRACRRCRPDDGARDAAAVAKAVALIDAQDGVPTLAALGAATGYARRIFSGCSRAMSGSAPPPMPAHGAPTGRARR